MTSGPILRNMLLFALPLIFTNLLQMLYNATDMIVVGLSSEPDAVGAIGTTTSFAALIVSLFIGLSIGANVVVARHIGAKDEKRASRALHTSVVIALIFGIVGAVIGVAVARPVMMLMGNEGKLIALLPAEEAERAIEIVRSSPYGENAAIIGTVASGDGVILRTPLGGRRKIGPLVGEGLPRIC